MASAFIPRSQFSQQSGEDGYALRLADDSALLNGANFDLLKSTIAGCSSFVDLLRALPFHKDVGPSGGGPSEQAAPQNALSSGGKASEGGPVQFVFVQAGAIVVEAARRVEKEKSARELRSLVGACREKFGRGELKSADVKQVMTLQKAVTAPDMMLGVNYPTLFSQLDFQFYQNVTQNFAQDFDLFLPASVLGRTMSGHTLFAREVNNVQAGAGGEAFPAKGRGKGAPGFGDRPPALLSLPLALSFSRLTVGEFFDSVRRDVQTVFDVKRREVVLDMLRERGCDVDIGISSEELGFGRWRGNDLVLFDSRKLLESPDDFESFWCAKDDEEDDVAVSGEFGNVCSLVLSPGVQKFPAELPAPLTLLLEEWHTMAWDEALARPFATGQDRPARMPLTDGTPDDTGRMILVRNDLLRYGYDHFDRLERKHTWHLPKDPEVCEEVCKLIAGARAILEQPEKITERVLAKDPDFADILPLILQQDQPWNYYLDQGGNSVELERSTPMVDTIDLVTKRAYLEYHGLGGGGGDEREAGAGASNGAAGAAAGANTTEGGEQAGGGRRLTYRVFATVPHTPQKTRDAVQGGGL